MMADVGMGVDVVMTSTGQPVEAGEALSMHMAFEEVVVTAAFGKFSSELSHPIEARMAMPSGQLGSGAVLPQCTPFGF